MALFWSCSLCLPGQSSIHDVFSVPDETWRIAGGLIVNPEKPGKVAIIEGDGVLVNEPHKRKGTKDLLSVVEFGSMDVEFDFMLTEGVEASISIHELYDIHLKGSWGSESPSAYSHGGISIKGSSQGYTPRQLVGFAPGLWQHLTISFETASFERDSNSVTNPRIRYIELNGVTIHENVELVSNNQPAITRGLIKFHISEGVVALRNFSIAEFDNPPPEPGELRFSVYEGKYESVPDFESLEPVSNGVTRKLTSDLNPKPQRFLIRYAGELDVKTAGRYRFDLDAQGGAGCLQIAEKQVIDFGRSRGEVELPSGIHPIEIIYSKHVSWKSPSLGLSVEGPGIRQFLISDPVDKQEEATIEPIIIEASDIPVLRSFIDLEGGDRITHAVSVGSEKGLHYSYDLNRGTIMQVWKGGFLDATPMWYDRGDGSSKPYGSVKVLIHEPLFTMAQLASEMAPWPKEPVEGFEYKSYWLDVHNNPTFQYSVYGRLVSDKITVTRKGLSRVMELDESSQQLYVRVAMSDQLKEVGKNLFMVGDGAYYIKINDTGGADPILRSSGSGIELIVPILTSLHYEILL